MNKGIFLSVLALLTATPALAQDICSSLKSNLQSLRQTADKYTDHMILERDWNLVHIKLMRRYSDNGNPSGDELDLRLEPKTEDLNYNEVQSLTKSIYLVITKQESVDAAMKKRLAWCKKHTKQ